MEGKILDYSFTTKAGLIRSNEGIRYEFSADEYRSQTEIQVGQTVDFEIDANTNKVLAIYALPEDSNHPITDSLPQSGQVISEKVMETSKEAVADIGNVFKLIQKDPANGLKEALVALGDNRALNAGIVLCVLCVLFSWAAIVKLANSLLWWLNTGLGLSQHIQIILISAVPVIGIIFLLWAIRQIFKSAGNYKQFTFATGVCLFPVTVFLFILWLIGYGSPDFLALLSIFCITTLILLLNTTLIGVLRLSARNALFLVPLILVADTFITRIFSEILF